MRNLISILDLSTDEIDELIKTANDIIANPDKYADKCKRKKLATLFFEPSTRTRLSFEAAMMELGGNVIGFSESSSSSASKGESVSDTVRVVSCYADIIAMRHPKEGAPMVASMKSSVPIINAGDGGHNHPTQTLADLLTIKREKGHFENLTVGMCGDLKFGRTVHSLIHALSRYTGVKFVLISPDELKIPTYLKTDFMDKNNIEYDTIISNIENNIKKINLKKEKILDLLINNIITNNEYKEKNNNYNNDISILKKKIDILREEKNKKSITPQKLINEVKEKLEYKDILEDFINTFLEKVIVYKNNDDRKDLILEIYMNIGDIKNTVIYKTNYLKEFKTNKYRVIVYTI